MHVGREYHHQKREDEQGFMFWLVEQIVIQWRRQVDMLLDLPIDQWRAANVADALREIDYARAQAGDDPLGTLAGACGLLRQSYKRVLIRNGDRLKRLERQLLMVMAKSGKVFFFKVAMNLRQERLRHLSERWAISRHLLADILAGKSVNARATENISRYCSTLEAYVKQKSTSGSWVGIEADRRNETEMIGG